MASLVLHFLRLLRIHGKFTFHRSFFLHKAAMQMMQYNVVSLCFVCVGGVWGVCVLFTGSVGLFMCVMFSFWQSVFEDVCSSAGGQFQFHSVSVLSMKMSKFILKYHYACRLKPPRIFRNLSSLNRLIMAIIVILT